MFQNNVSMGRMHEDIRATRWKVGKTILEQKIGIETTLQKWINNMENCYTAWNNALRRKYTSILSEQHSKRYKIGKYKAMMDYTDFGLKDSLPSLTDWLSKGIDAYKK